MLNIGDKVVLKSDGSIHTITDKFYSEKNSKFFYELDNNEAEIEAEADIEPATERGNYDFKFEILDTVIVATLFLDGNEIGRGHGHIIHQGNIGIAQAASYALKKLYENIGGTF